MGWLQTLSYSAGILVNDFFPYTATGIQPIRDQIATDFTPGDLLQKLKTKMKEEGCKAREDLLATGPSRRFIQPYDYRPFDQRWIYYLEDRRGLLAQPLHHFAPHVLGKANRILCLLGRQRDLPRHQLPAKAWISNRLLDKRMMSSAENFVAVPMVLYDNDTPDGTPNLHPYVIDIFASKLDQPFRHPAISDKRNTSFDVADVFHYLYALLHGPDFRQQFASDLRGYHARIPLPDHAERFHTLARLGQQLADTQMLIASSPSRPKLFGNFDAGELAAAGTPVWQNQTISLSKNLWIDSIRKEVYTYSVGGYQPVLKWIKDRRETLRRPEALHPYLQMLAAIKQSLVLEQHINQALL